MLHRFTAVIGTVLLAAVISLPAYGATIIWTFDDVTNDVNPNAQLVTGFFDYSTVSHSITDFDLSANGIFSGAIHGPASIEGNEIFFGNSGGTDPLVLALAVANLAGPNNMELGGDSYVGKFVNGTPVSTVAISGQLNFKDPPDPAGSPGAPSPTPLPAAFLLLSSGLLVLLSFAAWRKLRRRI